MTISRGSTEQLVLIAGFLPRHWLYEWFSQFHSCGTYSFFSRSLSIVALGPIPAQIIIHRQVGGPCGVFCRGGENLMLCYCTKPYCGDGTSGWITGWSRCRSQRSRWKLSCVRWLRRWRRKIQRRRSWRSSWLRRRTNWTRTRRRPRRTPQRLGTGRKRFADELLKCANETGRSGLAVACLTAVREVLVLSRAVCSCVYRTTTAIYSLGHGLCAPFLQCLGQLSLLPSLGR